MLISDTEYSVFAFGIDTSDASFITPRGEGHSRWSVVRDERTTGYQGVWVPRLTADDVSTSNIMSRGSLCAAILRRL